MTTAQFAAFSNNAVAFASVVYVLAFLAHVTEWALARTVPVRADRAAVPAAGTVREPVSVGASAPPPATGTAGDTGAEGAAARIQPVTPPMRCASGMT